MEQKKTAKSNLLVFLLIFAILAIVLMGIFIYKLNSEKTAAVQKAAELQTEISSLNGTGGETNGSDELYIIQEIDISSEQKLYNFKTKEWVQEITGAEGMYYIAMDSEKNLYIVDRFENIVKKLDARLEKLKTEDTDVDNYVTRAAVSQEDNTLVISTGDDFITFIVSLEDFSTSLAEVNDD